MSKLVGVDMARSILRAHVNWVLAERFGGNTIVYFSDAYTTHNVLVLCCNLHNAYLFCV